MVEKSSVATDIANLTEEQITMLQLSENDIENNKFSPQNELDKRDLAWLKGL